MTGQCSRVCWYHVCVSDTWTLLQDSCLGRNLSWMCNILQSRLCSRWQIWVVCLVVSMIVCNVVCLQQLPLPRLSDPQRERHGRLLEERHQDASPHRLPGRVAVAVNSRHFSGYGKKNQIWISVNLVKLDFISESLHHTHTLTYSPLLQQRLDVCYLIESVTQNTEEHKQTREQRATRVFTGTLDRNYLYVIWKFKDKVTEALQDKSKSFRGIRFIRSSF